MQIAEAGERLSSITELEVIKPRIEDSVIIGGIPVLDIQFGNVWTNIPKALLESSGLKLGDAISVRVLHDGQERFRDVLHFVPSFGHVDAGTHLLYVNSLLHASLGINCSSFAAEHSISSGTGWTVELKKLEG